MEREESLLLYSAATLRQWEEHAAAQGLQLMAEAGSCIAKWIQQHYPQPSKILALVGPGDNGGDALIAAAELRQYGYQVTAWMPQTPKSQEAKQALISAQLAGVVLHQTWQPPCYDHELILDGLFGIGLQRAPTGEWAQLIAWANQQTSAKIAIDVPSGLDAWRGTAFTPTLRAQHTLTFLAAKPGLWTGEGRDYCGKIDVFVLSVDKNPALAEGEINRPSLSSLQQLVRSHASHKGRYGTTAIIGGSDGMVGAAILAGRAALLTGSGKVQLYCVAPTVRYDAEYPELMMQTAEANQPTNGDCYVVGPGLGQSQQATTLLSHALDSDVPLVLDADALNLLAQNPDLIKQIMRRQAETLLTPHPGEAARLLGCSIAEIQQDRLAACHALRQRYHCHILLKGAGSLIMQQSGYYHLNPNGNPGMASAGQGDVLSGVIGGLVAQGLPLFTAATLAAHVHATAGDQLAAQAEGYLGLTASRTAQQIPIVLNRWIKTLLNPY